MGRLARTKERKREWRSDLKRHKAKLKDQKKRFQLRPVKFPTKNLDMIEDESSNNNPTQFADESFNSSMSTSRTPESEMIEAKKQTIKEYNRRLNMKRDIQLMQQQSNDHLSVHERIDQLCGTSKKRKKQQKRDKRTHHHTRDRQIDEFLEDTDHSTDNIDTPMIEIMTRKTDHTEIQRKTKKKKNKKRGKGRPKGVAGLILAELRQNPVRKVAKKSVTNNKKKHPIKNHTDDDGNGNDNDDDGQSIDTILTSKKKRRKKDRIVSHLNEAQFRYLNEVLYTSSGSDAFQMMQRNKEDFETYHDTYNVIVEGNWPESPLLLIYKQLCRYMRETQHLSNAPVIADFGCGDAKLAAAFKEYSRQSRRYSQVKVHSFDLVALNDFVTECDMAHTPLEDSSVDMAVFCLSLMGNNFHEYLMEAHRVLKPMGLLKIAEVKSRLIGHTSKRFRGFLDLCGFKVLKENDTNTHFILIDCVKSITKKCKVSQQFDPLTVLKPCLYKKR